MDRKYDKIIIGAGLYGLYAAKRCSDKGEKVLVLNMTEHPFREQPILIRPGCIWDIIIQEALRQQ